MKRFFATLLVVAFIAAAVPAVNAEVKNASYDVPSGATGNFGAAVSTRACGPEWDDDSDAEGIVCPAARGATGREGTGVVNVGIYSDALKSDCGDCYTNFLVSITDTLPAETYFSFCVITEYQDGRDDTDSWCGEDPSGEPDDIEDPNVAGCGSETLTSATPAGGEDNGATAFVYAHFTDETTGQVCFGSSGTMTVDMS
ncbi:MAG: hypothetical protein KY455_10800 [Euryarchaeota archaeon]|nr:hypothetical protein [Euryarchaeota archaeon]